ncbi:type-F conjugative transfer system protein TraW [Rubrivivax gelatinosus]|uniref:type-F conjugative transfer system protein TraW n=1 Tax=Rubrivivax gelatinosus TaxID=28068 RepID=UPI0006819062|nr:type-F conjugative transfer system protein TraW [Rubrivivax gelatinosus]MBG6083026.1 conjugal transfer pilus assembly protein TraW [Rubrivivax gelatinosus]
MKQIPADLSVRGIVRASLLFAALLPWGAAHSQSLGTYGNVWGIAEMDAIDAIKGKLSQMEKSGQMKKLWEDYRDRYLATVENPAPLPGISKATEARVRTFDPTFTFGEDFEDQDGKVLVKAGTRVNPLDYTPLTKALIFIDGRDPEQVAFAKARSDLRPLDKVILVAGSFLKLNREWGRPTYFDQRGHLTTKLGIKKVPAVVSQQGRVLRIEEIALEGNR